MTKEELRQFLQERGAKPSHINKIEQSFSPEVIGRILTKAGFQPTDEAVELNASIIRTKFAEKIRINEVGGISWDDIKNQLG